MAQDIVVPAPPSTNSLFRNVPGVGRVRTDEYQAWRAEAVNMVRVEHPGLSPATMPVEIVIRAGARAGGRVRDLDNFIKPTLDMLVQAGVIEDDDHKRVPKVCIEWDESLVEMFPVLKVRKRRTVKGREWTPEEAYKQVTVSRGAVVIRRERYRRGS